MMTHAPTGVPRAANRKTASLVVVGFTAATLLSGCASTQDGKVTQAGGASAGAVLGAVLGGVIAGRDGALLGAAIGAGIGYAVGSEIADRKQKYADLQQFYDAQIAGTAQMNQELASMNRNLSKEIDKANRDINSLKKVVSLSKSNEKKVQDLQTRLDTAHQKASKALDVSKKELKAQKEVLAELQEKEGAEGKRTVQLRTRVGELESQIADLNRNVTVIAGLRTAPGQFK